MSLKKTSFTIVEIVMVLVILGILAAVALPVFIDMAVQSKNASDDFTIGTFRGVINSLYLKSVVDGTVTYPTMSQITDNLVQPIFYNGVTANQWSYIEFLGGDIVVIYCPHGVGVLGRRVWVYFRINIGAFGAGSIVEFGAGPHT